LNATSPSPVSSGFPNPTSFEEALRSLEETVERLSAGDLPLEESLTLFEQGVGSLKLCHAILDKAEKRVQMLVQGTDGTAELRETDPTAGTPSRALTPVPIRKKSARARIDGGVAGRQNAPPNPQVQQACPTERAPERQEDRSTDEGDLNERDSGSGGSLFGVAQ
jgi:exodeoxyribonuclease VII small subunit